MPSSFDRITESDFKNAGVNIVIYANHMLRAAYPAMLDVAKPFSPRKDASMLDQNAYPLKKYLESFLAQSND